MKTSARRTLGSIIPRQEVYDTYWYFAAERQRIFESRLSGEQGPWSNDPIFQTYKFCNVFRAADRVSQYMIRSVCYGDDVSEADRLFQIVAFRTFSKPATWEALRHQLGHYPLLEDLRSGAFERTLTELRDRGERIYTGAFILCANDAFGRRIKHLNHVELFKHMFLHDDGASQLLAALSLKELFETLRGYPLFGDFMAYQTAIDLNYSALFSFSEDDFTKAGPGALRGIEKVFLDTGGRTPEEIILWMTARQEAEFARLDLEFNGLWGRRLHAIDAQGLFCETDKYSRLAFPELRVQRSRMKAKFQADPQPIEYFFPPKWGINAKVPSSPVQPASRTHKQAPEPQEYLFL